MGLMPTPLIAVEIPLEGATDNRQWRVLDASRNRDVGVIQQRWHHVEHKQIWRWYINAPREERVQIPSPTGDEASLQAALTAFRAAFDRYGVRADYPGKNSAVWSDAARYGEPLPGQGPWLPGKEPLGWRQVTDGSS